MSNSPDPTNSPAIHPAINPETNQPYPRAEPVPEEKAWWQSSTYRNIIAIVLVHLVGYFGIPTDDQSVAQVTELVELLLTAGFGIAILAKRRTGGSVPVNLKKLVPDVIKAVVTRKSPLLILPILALLLLPSCEHFQRAGVYLAERGVTWSSVKKNLRDSRDANLDRWISDVLNATAARGESFVTDYGRLQFAGFVKDKQSSGKAVLVVRPSTDDVKELPAIVVTPTPSGKAVAPVTP